MSHYDVYQGICFTVTLSRVISHYGVKPWFVTVLCGIATIINCYVNCTFLNCFVALRHSSRVVSDLNIHKGIYWITTFINTHIGLQHSSMVHLLMVLLHWDIHHNDRIIYSWILKFIISQCLCHIIRYHVVRIFFIYIYSRLTKEMV